MRIQYLLFDADGTVFDSMPFYTEIFSNLLARQPLGIPQEESRRFYLSTPGTDLADQFRQVLEQHRKPVDAVSRLVGEFFDMVAERQVQPFPDAEEVLPQLSTYTICLVSGTATAILERRLSASGLGAYIRYVYGYDDHSPTKGEAFVRMRERFGNDFTKYAVYVGDGVADIKLGLQQGVIAIGRVGLCTAQQLRKAGAQYVIEDFHHLVQVLGELNERK